MLVEGGSSLDVSRPGISCRCIRTILRYSVQLSSQLFLYDGDFSASNACYSKLLYDWPGPWLVL